MEPGVAWRGRRWKADEDEWVIICHCGLNIQDNPTAHLRVLRPRHSKVVLQHTRRVGTNCSVQYGCGMLKIDAIIPLNVKTEGHDIIFISCVTSLLWKFRPASPSLRLLFPIATMLGPLAGGGLSQTCRSHHRQAWLLISQLPHLSSCQYQGTLWRCQIVEWIFQGIGLPVLKASESITHHDL